ncbi:DapH/DapD/GlmU-related protein [Uliginosibacterium sp. 31-16]|uniref:acyltransferase n=1 Tax=Uliginosibacterium sp. 31-16 TaxID=3068315 RepID=UPI00273FEFD9|nr:DapH/DapD/GlmU-related protein [Uliginosibacterium sp. 31-16]MDP5240571.1 DapH/DapD/GlmU-related protein [Uliginosibacterium sp. 31-16]
MPSLILGLFRRLFRRLSGRDPLATLVRRGLVVGRNFYMQDGCVIDACHCWHITIGDDVTLGPNVTILAHDASTKRALGYVRLGKVAIGHRVFIGADSIVLPGVKIGSDVIIGAGSVVTADIPAGSLAAGNPARVLGTTADYLARQQALLASSPCFGEAYTLRANVSASRKNEMNAKMGDGPGFIV